MISLLWNITGMITLLLLVGSICYMFVQAVRRL